MTTKVKTQNFDIDSKGFFRLNVPEVVVIPEEEEPVTPEDPTEADSDTDPTEPSADGDEDETEAADDPVTPEEPELPEGEYWNIDTSMSRVISPYHMSIVLTRVNVENLGLEPGKPLNAYFMAEEKDVSAYRAISSQEAQVQWLSSDLVTKILYPSLSQATTISFLSVSSTMMMAATLLVLA